MLALFNTYHMLNKQKNIIQQNIIKKVKLEHTYHKHNGTNDVYSKILEREIYELTIEQT